jgi:hypothetical protein
MPYLHPAGNPILPLVTLRYVQSKRPIILAVNDRL